MRRSLLCMVGVSSFFPHYIVADERPNFVWLMAEDVAPHFMGLYNEGRGAQTPNLDRMAQEGLVFEHAYSNAPVSSAARSTLITGCYAPKLGISFHRKLELQTLPDEFHMFPAYLRKAGYFTANSSKTDYNCKLDTTAWDMVQSKLGDWRLRNKTDQPFFYVRTNAACHESCLHFTRQQMNNRKTHHGIEKVKLLPTHPDTPIFRYSYATFYDRISEVDRELGKIMDMLRQDGVLDNTFIFYFGDNGGCLPGSKGYTGETGIKVPLVVYVPEKWRNKLPLSCGDRVNGLVSFMDFGPTLLHLAGLTVPEHMDGTPFLGEDVLKEDMEAKDVVYGYGDRFDELYAFNRTVRKGNFKYSRNFVPYHSKSLYAFYRYKQLAFLEWRTLYEEVKLNEIQSRFFKPQGAEELYDLSTDPYETVNLASRSEYSEILNEMRSLINDNMLKQHDLGLLPECVWLEEGRGRVYQYGCDSEERLKRLKDVADLQLLDFSEATSELDKALRSTDPVERWWALTVCASFGKEALVFKNIAKELMKDDNAYVRIRAMVFLSSLGEHFNKQDILPIFTQSKTGAESLLVLNDVVYMVESGLISEFELSEEEIPLKCTGVNWRVKYLNEMFVGTDESL